MTRNWDRRLRAGNIGLAVIHAAQAAAILALSTSFALPVTGAFMSGPPGSGTPAQETLFHVRIGPVVAAFLLLAALDHALVGLPLRRRYEAALARGVNPYRWLEYSVSASLMVALIAMLTGVADYVALLGLMGVNAAMILFGWLMELFNPPDRERTRWLPFVFACVAGVVPWIAIGAQIGVSVAKGNPPPAFVYAIFVTLFLLFNSFAVNQALQYARVGRWRDYRYGEWCYLVLSLVAKSLLAWQVFANALVLKP
ncbi:MAG TPA: heliorhodopsin HeR [Gaiellaceae bacterium]|nr:heliorhodopsin HeR [Gaiellaceae bacterium]